MLGAGFFIHWLIPGMPLAVAFALAAIVSPTDPVAVSSIASRAPIPRRLMHILEGESLLNDASGLVCFQFAVAAALTGAFSLGSATLTFLWVALAGLASGVVFTAAVAFVQQWVTRRFGEAAGSPILVNLLMPFGAYLLAEKIHASGILAAVAAGIAMSYVELSGRSMARTRLERTAVWNTIQFTLNGIMFVLLGEQLPGIVKEAVATVQQTGHRSAWWLLLYAVAITAGLAALRFTWVWVSLRLNLLRRHRATERTTRIGWRLILATSLAGVRGAITLAGILTLPLLMADGTPFPMRGLAVFLAAAVIVLSLVGASIGLPPLLKGLELPREPVEQREQDRARAMAAKAAIESIRQAHQAIEKLDKNPENDIYADAANRVIDAYQKRIQRDAPDDPAAEQLRQADTVERKFRLTGLQAEREEILNMARRRGISDETSRRLVRDIDLRESLYR